MYTHQNVSMYANKRMNIRKLIIQETGTYNQQWKRPFETGLQASGFNQILENVDQAKAITPAALAGVANQFIHPSATPESTIIIPEGWNERRLRFFMEVETETQVGTIQTEYVVGYTNYSGLSFGGALDPNMVFYINSVNTTRKSFQNTPMGNMAYQNVIDSSHILANDHYAGISTPNQLWRLRPEDVFGQIESNEIAQETQGDFLDTRLTINREPIKSRRTNAVAPVFVSSILDSYLQSQRGDINNSNRFELIENAKAAIKSQSISTDPFISFIRGNNSNAPCNQFTYADLQRLDPNVDNVRVVLSLTPTLQSTIHTAGQTADWGGSTGETLFATCVSQSLPGYMLDHCINKFHFMSTNRDIGCNITTKVVDVKSLMQGIDITPHIQSLIFKLEKELLKDLSYNNQMDFMIDVRCDLIGETWINVSLNNGPIYTYVTPSFADALMSPVTSYDQNKVVAIANDFENLMGHIGDSGLAYGGMPGNNSFGNI